MKIRIFCPKVNSQFLSFCDKDEIYSYLSVVLRVKIGQIIYFFNQNEGEFAFQVFAISRKEILFQKNSFEQEAHFGVDLQLAFCISKQHYISDIVEKCTQIGIVTFLPIISEYSQNISHFKPEKLAKIATEAVEQSGRFQIPSIKLPLKLIDFLEMYSHDSILFANESHDPQSLVNNENKIPKIALVGCEGGFSDAEIQLISSYKNVISYSFGFGILKCDTACVISSYEINKMNANSTA